MRPLPRLLSIASLGLVTTIGHAASLTAIEYFHQGNDHYFVTTSAQETADLDAGRFPGWRRTGESFGVLELDKAGGSNVCRYWSAQTFAPKSSHFYTPFAWECVKVAGDPNWLYEGEVFGMHSPDPSGSCAAGTIPLYRLYNNGRSGAPNHRYTSNPKVRSDMVARGWTPEGMGIGVIGCVPAPDSFTVVAAGDIAHCPNLPASASVAARTAALVTPQDDLALPLGDLAYDSGTHAEFADCFDPTWGAFKDRLRPVPGNHEYRTPGAAGYFDYFGAQAGPDRRGYYSFDYGGWHFIALNSEIDVSVRSQQYQWLKADLARSSQSLCTIAYWHRPAFSSGVQHGSTLEMRPFFDALHAAGVEMVLSGDEHFYERFAPQRADGTADPARGVRQFVAGAGGKDLYPIGAPLPNSEFRYNANWGVLRLTLGLGHYGWQFVPVGGGAPIDAGSAPCHR